MKIEGVPFGVTDWSGVPETTPPGVSGVAPWRTVQATYDLEYGTDTVQMHADALEPGESVLVVDDVIATGGTARAVGQLVEQVGAKVAAQVFLVELSFLGGRARLAGYETRSLIVY